MRAVAIVDPHAAEENVPDHLFLDYGDQRKDDSALEAQAIDQAGLVGPFEGSFIDGANGDSVVRVLASDD
jgi:hypothetical protein